MKIIKLVEDKAQQINKHLRKNAWWKEHGIEVERYPLPCGDYIIINDKVQDVINRKANRGIEVKKMDFLGTYNICVDSKKDIQELIGDICGKQHERFRDECILAQNNGIQLYILVENVEGYADKRQSIWNNRVKDLSELHSWVNPRLCLFRAGKQLYPTATRGITLQKACYSMEQKYGVKFVFCHPSESGRRIIELLTGENWGHNPYQE